VAVTVFPAIVIVAVREDVPVFETAEYATAPLPCPLEPLVILSHEALEEAVQEQPAVPVTATVPVAPAAAGASDVGETEKLQVTPA
jgi:hypothetical protein